MTNLPALLEEVRRPLPPDRLAGVALELAQVSSTVTAAMDSVKSRLRALAAERLEGGSNSVTLSGVANDGVPLGSVTVTFPERSVSLAKGADLDHLRTLLGDQFDRFFETVTTVRPRDELPLALVPGDVAVHLLEHLKISEATPRVGFKPLGPFSPPIFIVRSPK